MSSCTAARLSLAALTLLDFRPTAVKQLEDAHLAIAVATATDVADRQQQSRRADLFAVQQWARLVRGKVLGEVIGLCVATLRPCAGACMVLLSHMMFWVLGAASFRVDAAAEPAPLPMPLARIIFTADAIVLTFAAIGAMGATSAVRATGAGLFSTAGALVSAQQISKALKRRRIHTSAMSASATASASISATASTTTSDHPMAADDPAAISGVDGESQRTNRAVDPQMMAPSSSQGSADAASLASEQLWGPKSPDCGIWAEQWWPVCFAAHTGKDAPYPMTLLGAPLVIWWDGGQWQCTVDRCSHRLAPLSEGRVTSDGCIECPCESYLPMHPPDSPAHFLLLLRVSPTLGSFLTSLDHILPFLTSLDHILRSFLTSLDHILPFVTSHDHL